MPQTPEEAELVEQTADAIQSDPDLNEKLRNVVSQVNWSGVVRELAP